MQENSTFFDLREIREWAKKAYVNQWNQLSVHLPSTKTERVLPTLVSFHFFLDMPHLNYAKKYREADSKQRRQKNVYQEK